MTLVCKFWEKLSSLNGVSFYSTLSWENADKKYKAQIKQTEMRRDTVKGNETKSDEIRWDEMG